MGKKIDEIDLVRGVAICLVFIGHAATDSFLVRPVAYEFIVQYIYAFHMALFFVVSGFLDNRVNEKRSDYTYLEFLKKKFIRLIIPFVAISIMINLMVSLKQILVDNNISVKYFFKMLKDNLIYPELAIRGSLWFLYVLFIISIISPLLRRFDKRIVIVIAILINILVPKELYLFALNKISFYLIYYLLGSYFKESYDNYKLNNYHINKYIITLFLLIIGIYSFIIIERVYIDTIVFSIYKFVVGFIGIIVIVYLVRILINNKSARYIFRKLGMYSMDIYIFSWFFQILSMIFITRVLNISNYTIFFIANCIFGAISLPFSIFLIRKFKVTKLLFLGLNRIKVQSEV